MKMEHIPLCWQELEIVVQPAEGFVDILLVRIRQDISLQEWRALGEPEAQDLSANLEVSRLQVGGKLIRAIIRDGIQSP